jgi:hypothetical protein
VESEKELQGSYAISGWAMDARSRRRAAAIIAEIGDVVVSSASPTIIRPDIEAGIGSVRPAGFSLDIVRWKDLPDAPIRLFALTADGYAAPLAADAGMAAPIAAVPFVVEPAAARARRLPVLHRPCSVLST